MDLRGYIRLVRKRWISIVVTTLAVIALAGIATLMTPKSYRATSELFVSTSSSETTADLASGSTFTSKQIKTYADVVTSPKVLNPVRQALGKPENAGLADGIAATVPKDTMLIDVLVTDRDPAKAAQVANTIADQFPKTVDELHSTANGKPSPVKVTVIRHAVTPTTPVSPQPLRNLALGTALGLLLGLGVAFLKDRLDTRVKTEQDVKDVADATVIGAIHFDPDSAAHPLIVHADPHSVRAEAFRTLRTNLQFIDAECDPKVLVMTSSLPGEGKTTTTANLALTMGAAGAKVCVIEGDLRRPKLLEYMGLESGVGLTSVLIGEAELDDVLQPFAPRVYALGAGPIPPNPSELLGSRRMRAVLDQLRGQFDYVIIDAPPLLPVTDAAVLSTIVDGTVLVVGSGVVNKENVVRALESLQTVGGRTLGIVMNRIPTKGADSYSYYGNRYGYAPETQETSRKAKWGRKGATRSSESKPAGPKRILPADAGDRGVAGSPQRASSPQAALPTPRRHDDIEPVTEPIETRQLKA